MASLACCGSSSASTAVAIAHFFSRNPSIIRSNIKTTITSSKSKSKSKSFTNISVILHRHRCYHLHSNHHRHPLHLPLPASIIPLKPTIFLLPPHSSLSQPGAEAEGPTPTPSSSPDPNPSPNLSTADEWGEKPEPYPEYSNAPDPPIPNTDDEWQQQQQQDDDDGDYYYAPPASAANVSNGNNSPPPSPPPPLPQEQEQQQQLPFSNNNNNTISDLKRCLVDTVYGTDFGFRASPEVRAEVSELVTQLEALNPTPSPVDATLLLNGNWLLLYTAFSELLPLLAAGATPLLKVDRIAQAIDTTNLSIVNSTTLSSPFATFSFSASASFEVRSPSRIQVEFKDGTLQPPEIKSSVDLPETVDLFGQKINLSPVRQSLNPLQDVVANISRTISGQSPLKVPIPGNRSNSWLLITYLDEDLRISRGDGGLFVLAKEGSPLLDL